MQLRTDASSNSQPNWWKKNGNDFSHINQRWRSPPPPTHPDILVTGRTVYIIKSQPVNSAGGEEFLKLTWCKVCGCSLILRNRHVGQSSTRARGVEAPRWGEREFHRELEQSGEWNTQPAENLQFYRTVWPWQNKTWCCLCWNDFQKRIQRIL